ncbi:flagellar protein FlgN [Nesterenkonia lutea]|uniref:Antirestriction protein ArdC n=1 Tax=Nesterenkonia lutea TaxID=272919 RepID=A0ABR9JGQ7_9MICC|nr:flagellar protein FlgN [Nesterenkonia lutea]MBE1524652.1 antirestriction protein ArdC [Nesterenkonia lutea]
MSVNALSTRLWRERELLDLLQFKLEEQQLLLVSGKSRWVGHAAREIETVLEKLREASLSRAVASSWVAAELGMPEDVTLAQLAAAVNEPAWREVLNQHLQALRTSASSITALRDTNSTYLRSAQRAAQESLAALDSEPSGSAEDNGPRLLDTKL